MIDADDAFLCFKESGKESLMMARKFPDWNDFKTKANGACRDRFEDLCRMLFCNELGIDQGTL